MQNFDSLFAVNVRAPYFLSSGSCEPRLGVFLTSAAHAALTNSQLMQPPRERSKPWSGILPSSSASTAPVCGTAPCPAARQ
jgi:hypothetical protein